MLIKKLNHILIGDNYYGCKDHIWSDRFIYA